MKILFILSFAIFHLPFAFHNPATQSFLTLHHIKNEQLKVGRLCIAGIPLQMRGGKIS